MTVASVLLDILSVIPLILSALSFVPQILKLHRIRTSDGISLVYVLLNLIVATHHFTIAFCFDVVLDHNRKGSKPVDLAEWLDFSHFSIVVLGHLLVFIQILALQQPIRTVDKVASLTGYLFYVLFTFVPALYCMSIPENPNSFVSFGSLLLAALMWYLNLPITLLGIAALWFQYTSNMQALSLRGLRVQAVVFSFVGFSMIIRYPIWLKSDFADLSWFEIVKGWYLGFGYLVVNNLVFAFGQGFLAYVIAARRKADDAREEEVDGEREPLLPAPA